jgi:hypothetical protein
MLSSARISEFEPRLTPSPSSTRVRTYRQTRTFTDAPQASTSRLPSPPKQSPDIPSCLSPSSAFYQVLTAQYQPAASPLVRPRSLVGPWRNETSHDFVDWSTKPTSSNESDTRDGEFTENDATAFIFTGRRIYTPHGPWAWADGLSIDDTEELTPLQSGLTCSASIKRGTLGDRRITYISKCWNTSQQHRWLGFYSELSLYKADRYLKPLQGDILPWIIGVHALPGVISIAMEPPHHSFWIEASADMPNVLKERCIEAFEKIHACGVLHGDVELRHMLIGGDGKVTIINFQRSRALVPNLDVMLLEATPSDLKLEMRKVKYKLDYDGAREMESEKIARSEERHRRNAAHGLETLRDGEGAGKAKEDFPEDDIINPPVSTQDWNEGWANATANAPPTRFVVPGHASEALERELRNFLTILDRMAATSSPGRSTSNSDRRQVRFASKISSTRFVDPFPDEEAVPPAADNPPHPYGLRKRKLDRSSTSDTSLGNNRLGKRPRLDEESSIPLVPTTEDEEEPIRSGLRTDPILVNYMADQSLDKDRFTPPRTPLTEVPSTTSPSDSRFPPIKVRDFAYEPYEGPRGYYAPYRLIEAIASTNRRRWIHGQNEQRRTEAALSHPRLVAEGTIGSLNSASKQSISDKRLMKLALTSIGEHSVPEGMPASSRKRRRGDRESEMLEDDFIESDRRAAKARRLSKRADNNASHVYRQPSFDPLDADYTRGRTISRQSQDRGLPQIFERAQETASPDRRYQYSTVGERMAFATLGRPPPSSRIKSYPTSQPGSSSSDALKTRSVRSSATQINIGEPPRRKKTHHRGAANIPQPSKLRHEQSATRSPSPSSEEEVEALLYSSPKDRSHLPTFNPPSWVDFLLQWIP